MKKYIISTLCVLTLLLSSCSNEVLNEDFLQSQESDVVSRSEVSVLNPVHESAIPGMFYVKMDAASATQLQSAGEISLQAFSSMSSDIELAAKTLGVKSVEKVFPYNAKFEKRHRRYGLDRWYIVKYEEDKNVAEAIQTFSSVKQFEIVEPSYEVMMNDYSVTPVYMPHNYGVTNADNMPFNDPRLVDQWHYDNRGTAPGAVAGADINLFKAWEIETGKPNVVVAVIDDGVDHTHEDLKDNMWVNPNTDVPVEREGIYGSYIEEKHGGNFVPAGIRGNHGTHVAGTVAARNNNNIGVSGVAGGDGTPGSGVRIMGCLAIDTRASGQRRSHPEKAFVFAADNGAVIAQNSWGYAPEVPMVRILKDAIDYFIDNAGVDNEGNQLPNAPMKGGVVFFAAGNDNVDALSYPAAYERVIAVSGMSTNFTRSSFTNRGAWVDIMAPGGDQDRFGNAAGILSCIPNNTYGFYQGTSMACPHVSGIAGLVLSKNGGQGYTNDELKKAILSSLRPEDINAYNPREAGRLGRGYIDASLVFDKDEKIAPDVPTKGTEIDPTYTSIVVSWKVNKDDDDKLPTFQNLYISSEPLTADKLKNLKPIQLRVTVSEPGEEMYYTFKDLTHSTKYYVAIVSEDRWGNKSNPGFFEYSTRLNQAPVIKFSNLPENIVVTGNRVSSLDFEVSDPDGNTVDCTLEGQTTGVSFQYEKNHGIIEIRSVLSEGKYTFDLVAKDEFNAVTRKPITFNVVKATPLKIKGDFSQLVLGLNEKEFTLPLKDNIEYNPLLDIKFEANSSDESVVIISLSNDGHLSVIPLKKGLATIYIKATDDSGEKIETSFKVRVVEDSASPVHIIYPIPVQTTLNMIVNKSVQSPRVKVVTLNGKVVIDEAIDKLGKDGMVSLDVRNLSPNTYRLILESSNMARYEQVFVK